MYSHVQHTDENISQCKIFLSQVCPPILLSDMIDKIRVLNSIYSFLEDVKASKLAKLFGARSVSSDTKYKTMDTQKRVNIFNQRFDYPAVVIRDAAGEIRSAINDHIRSWLDGILEVEDST